MTFLTIALRNFGVKQLPRDDAVTVGREASHR